MPVVALGRPFSREPSVANRNAAGKYVFTCFRSLRIHPPDGERLAETTAVSTPPENTAEKNAVRFIFRSLSWLAFFAFFFSLPLQVTANVRNAVERAIAGGTFPPGAVAVVGLSSRCAVVHGR